MRSSPPDGGRVVFWSYLLPWLFLLEVPVCSRAPVAQQEVYTKSLDTQSIFPHKYRVFPQPPAGHARGTRIKPAWQLTNNLAHYCSTDGRLRITRIESGFYAD